MPRVTYTSAKENSIHRITKLRMSKNIGFIIHIFKLCTWKLTSQQAFFSLDRNKNMKVAIAIGAIQVITCRLEVGSNTYLRSYKVNK